MKEEIEAFLKSDQKVLAIDLCSNLFPYTEEEMKKVDEDDNFEPKANKICNEWFEYGEYGSFELIIDENMNIVGGKVIKTGK